MAEEDSFVILGSSPMPSLTDEDHAEKSESDGASSFSSLRRSQIAKETNINENTDAKPSRNATDSMKNNLFDAANTELSSSVSPNQSITVQTNGQNDVKAKETQNSMEFITSCSIEETNGNALNSIKSNGSAGSLNAKSVHEAQLNKQPESLRSKAQPSLASSFILGEVNADVLKASVYSQFPSICSMEACAEDVVKLQTFMTEYLDLKQTLLKVNDTMRQYYNQTVQWKENTQRVENQYRHQLEECQKQIAALRNQNLELTRKLETQMEQMKVMDELHQKDNKDLIQTISEKSAQISNMRAVIEKLEQQQLASFEYVQQGPSTSAQAKAEYVPHAEHKEAIKSLEDRISFLEAENKELSDSKPNYIDEINCLSVNLASAEELIKKFRADINLLKAKDIEKSEIFDRYEAERLEMREELTLLRQQVEIYSKDFEMERNSRQQLASEKDDLLQDLRALQRRNQELIEEAEKHMQRYTERAASAGVAQAMAARALNTSATAEATQSAIRAQSPSYNHPQRAVRQLPPPDAAPAPPSSVPIGPMRCPICSKQFPSLTILQSHASTCFG